MKKERDSLARELVTDRANHAKIEARIAAKQDQTDKLAQMVNFCEEKMEAYETLITESEEAYTKVADS
jgi:septal ring factor EnvC (AmiA/AmiB activator)